MIIRSIQATGIGEWLRYIWMFIYLGEQYWELGESLNHSLNQFVLLRGGHNIPPIFHRCIVKINCEDVLWRCIVKTYSSCVWAMTKTSMESLGPWPVLRYFHPKLIPAQCVGLCAYKWTLQALSPGSLQTLHNQNLANLPRLNCINFCATHPFGSWTQESGPGRPWKQT